MRATLTIDDDVLLAARALARQQSTHVGAVLSDLARRALQHPQGRSAEGLAGLGIKPLPKRGGIVTNELINRLRDDSIY